MRRISNIRFNALAGYCKHPYTELAAEECGFFEHGGERVLGLVFKDMDEEDYWGMVLARDRAGRYRCVKLINKIERSVRRAEVLLRHQMEQFSMLPDEEFYQGDEGSSQVDFFSPLVESQKMNADFVTLATSEGYSPAREIIKPMMKWHEDTDGNFIEQFQSTGFDARIWELYLFATFRELGYAIDSTIDVPDFSCSGIRGSFFVEATTVNPSRDSHGNAVKHPLPDTPEKMKQFIEEYMPTKFGSALFSKLNKKYWEKEHVANKPLVFAIQDFSLDSTIRISSSALGIYLYGYKHSARPTQNGELLVIPEKVKLSSPSGAEIKPFFETDGAENISAVIFSNSATIAKFNRIGFHAGFGSSQVKMERIGIAYNHEPNAEAPVKFSYVVGSEDDNETWVEGIEVYHNPNAINPIPDYMISGAVHHRLLDDGNILSDMPPFSPISSQTLIFLEQSEEA